LVAKSQKLVNYLGMRLKVKISPHPHAIL